MKPVISIIVEKNGLELMAKRKGSYCGLYCHPGGSIEDRESWSTAATRELFEETGIRCTRFEFVKIENILKGSGNYWIVWLKAVNWTGTAQTMEPDKQESWEWVDPNSVIGLHNLGTRLDLVLKGEYVGSF